MTHLGELGTTREPVDATFGWFGATVRVNPDLSELAILDLFASMAGLADDSTGIEAVTALRGAASVLVHADDLDVFWAGAVANRQTIGDVAELAKTLLSALTGRPTSLPSDSSGGQRITDTTSTDDSSSPALELLHGRPDLQVAVLRAERQRQAG